MELRYIEDETSNRLISARELATIARRYDFEPLADYDENLKWTNTNAFFGDKTMDTDFHDDHNHKFCYLCSVNQHDHERTKPRDESQRRKLIPYKNPKARLSSASSARTTTKNSSLSDLISYRFIVRTGTQNKSGTRAQVFLYMYGTENNWTSIHLPSASLDGFPSGSVRTFCLKGPDIGQLHHLNVNLVGARSENEWFLKEIEITNLNTSTTWLCEFNCWLPKTDEQEVNQIKPAVHRQTDFSLSMYILEIRTGGKSFAGTDANVHIIVRGSKASTHRLALTSNRANLFEQNQLDTFAIVGEDLGDLLEITVESDRSQLATDWDIKEMIMWKIIPSDDHEKVQVYFPFNAWLGKKVSTLKSKRELYPSTDHHFKGPICYQVSVKTGKITNAGTDANVFLIIYGKYGRTVIHQLHNRLKNDFERNSISEFTIMDIDIGKIDRIKIWHDNSGVGSAWFLDSVIIRKKYSTCHIISNIYIQRLEHTSKALYRQIAQQIKQTSKVRTSSANGNERRSTDRLSLKSNDYNENGLRDRLGSSRGILRSPTMYDKASLQKKVTWDEQSISSQDDLLSMNSQRSMVMQRIPEQKHKKEDSLPHETGHFNHQAYWISSHNYIENKWKIESIEEIDSFHFDQSTRSLLLSDRSAINHQIKTSIHDNEDEIYECQANRWLAKDKEDGKLEVYLSAKLTHPSSITSQTNIDSKKKHLTPPNITFNNQHQNHVDEKERLKEIKYSSAYDLGSMERPSKSLTPHDLRSSSSHLSKTQLNDLHVKQYEQSSRINPPIDNRLPTSASLTQLSKSPRNIHELTDSISSEQQLLARITGVPSYHSRTPTTSLIPPSQHLKSPRNIDERESLVKTSNELPNYPRLSSNQRLNSPRSINNLTTPIITERQSLTKGLDTLPDYPRSSRSNKDLTTPLFNSRDSLVQMSREPPNYPRSVDTSMSSRNTKDPIGPLTGEHELLARITGEPAYRSPLSSSSSATSLTPLNQRTKFPRNTNDLMNSSINEKETFNKLSLEPPIHPRLTSLSLSNQLSKSIRSSNESSSTSPRAPIEPLSRPKSPARSHPNVSSQKSIYDQVYNSAYGAKSSDDF